MRKNYRMVSVLSAMGMAALLMTSSVWAEAADSTAESVVSAVEDAALADSAASSAESVAEEVETAVRPEYRGLDFLTLGEYKGLTIEVDPIEISEESVDARITSAIQASEAGSDVLTEGVVEMGDVANIDYEGKKDGVAFDGGTSEDYDLEIGSGRFIDGFEDGLIGVAIGDTVDLELTFPEYYGNEDLAGQDVVFTVTVNSVKRYKELDDELASALSDGEASTVDEYREWTKGILEEQALTERETTIKSQLLAIATENSTVEEYPQDLVDYTVDEITSYYQYYASMYGVDFNTFLTAMVGVTEEDFPDMAAEMAKDSIKQEFCVSAIAEVEKLLPEGEELAAAYDELAASIGMTDGAALVAQYGEYVVNYQLMYDAVSDFLLENANIVERQAEVESGVESAAEAVVDVESVADAADAESVAEAVE